MQEKAFLVKVHKYVPAGEPGGSDVTVVRSGYLLCAALKRGDITERDVTFYQVAEVTGKWATAVAVDYDALCPDWYKG